VRSKSVAGASGLFRRTPNTIRFLRNNQIVMVPFVCNAPGVRLEVKLLALCSDRALAGQVEKYTERAGNVLPFGT